MNYPTKLTPEVAAAHKAAKLNNQMTEIEIKEVAKNGKKHCKHGHLWCVTNTAIYLGRRKCIVCAEAQLEALKGCANYEYERRALEKLKGGMPQSPFCQECGSFLVKAKCAPCYTKLRRERYAEMIKQTYGRDVNVRVRGEQETKDFFYYMPKPKALDGTHAAWLANHGIKVKPAVSTHGVDFTGPFEDGNDDGCDDVHCI